MVIVMTIDPNWFITWEIHDNEIGLDGKYHINTTGCGCCQGWEHLEPEEYIELLGNMIGELDKLLTRALSEL